MAHHGVESIPPALVAEIGRMGEELGATGDFPGGQIDETDKGEIVIGVTISEEKGIVLLHFGGEPVTWLGMTPAQAAELGRNLQLKAKELDRNALKGRRIRIR